MKATTAELAVEILVLAVVFALGVLTGSLFFPFPRDGAKSSTYQASPDDAVVITSSGEINVDVRDKD